MKIQGIIHQQIYQLRWHFLACLGLIMVLPIEEAIVSLKDGFGFHSRAIVMVSVMFAPLLTALIACANVQGDLNEKRYIFWRSKPVNVKLFITLKFFIGLFLSLIILASPLSFLFLSSTLYETMDDSALKFFLLLPLMLAIMTYSLCFGCNVLIRSTARSWLIGMLLTSFLLLLPFMLPLNFKDFTNMFEMSGIYLAIIPVASVIAFVFSLFAAQYDWHLKTNLKGLLWVGAGLVFVLMMIFSRQVANIKVLQEKEIEHPGWGWNSLDSAGDRVLFQRRSYIDINNNKISFSDIDGSPDDIAFPMTRLEGYHGRGYPGAGTLTKVIGDDLYSFSIQAYYRWERIEREEKPPIKKDIYEKVYLRSYKYTINSWQPVCELDISDCLADDTYPQVVMRLIYNKIIAFIDNSFVVVDATNPIELKLIDKKLNALKNRWAYYHTSRNTFSIPLVPTDKINIKERIKISIDWYCCYVSIYEASMVDVHKGKFAFFLVNDNNIVRFDVIRWDNENIYCKFSTARSFTILEQMIGNGPSFRYAFVENGRLYCWDKAKDTLLVFDIRSGRRIRKLGHFVRMDYEIDDIEVLNDGRILLCIRWEHDLRIKGRGRQRKRYLCLLENPG